MSEKHGDCIEFNCTGLHGLIQHGFADSSVAVIGVDHLEPVIDHRLSVTSIVNDDFAVLASHVDQLPSRNVDLIEMINTIDIDVLIVYLVFGWIMFRMVKKVEKSSLWLILRHLLKEGHHSVLGHHQPYNLVIIAVTMAIFWLHCMLGNQISTDLIAAPPPVLIDSVSDLLESNRLPIIGLKPSEKISVSTNTKWQQVWSRFVEANRSEVMTSKNGVFEHPIEYMIESKAVLMLMSRRLSLIERFYCMAEPVKNLLYKGRQRIGQSMEVRLLNPHVSRQLRSAIDRAHVAIEMYGIRHYADKVFAENIVGESAVIDRCLAIKGYQRNHMISVKPIGLRNVYYLILTTMVGSIVGVVFLAVEKRRRPRGRPHKLRKKRIRNRRLSTTILRTKSNKQK